MSQGAPPMSYCNYCAMRVQGHCEDSCKGSPYNSVRVCMDSGNWDRLQEAVVREIHFIEQSLLESKGGQVIMGILGGLGDAIRDAMESLVEDEANAPEEPNTSFFFNNRDPDEIDDFFDKD